MASVYKLVVSGSYRTAQKDIVDFENVVLMVPASSEEVAIMHGQDRYARAAIKAAKDKHGKPLYPERIEDVRQVFTDSIELVDADLSFEGVDIKEMSYEQLQDLASSKDLRTIPLPKDVSGVSLREMRAAAYAAYVDKVLHQSPIKDALETFGQLPPLVVRDTSFRVESQQKTTNEEIIESEQRNRELSQKDASSAFTFEELKKVATDKKIQFGPNISYKELYTKVFGTGADAGGAA